MNPAGQAAPPYAPPAYAAMTASQLYAATQLAKEDWSAAITDLRDQASELDRLTGPASAAQLAILPSSVGARVRAVPMAVNVANRKTDNSFRSENVFGRWPRLIGRDMRPGHPCTHYAQR